jgi:hypothetical protein
MVLAHRRRLLGLIAAGAVAPALTACGGGGDDGSGDGPGRGRAVQVLNLDADFPTVDLAFGATTVWRGLPFQAITDGIALDFGSYTLGLRDPSTGRHFEFPFTVDDFSPATAVFYRNGASARLVLSPTGIGNYFDSAESLVADLSDNAGTTQRSTLGFEQTAQQVSRSTNCRLRLSRASDGVLVYDSGLRFRPDAMLIYPASPTTGLVSVIAITYGTSTSGAVVWANTL